jgi:hypothetical protein
VFDARQLDEDALLRFARRLGEVAIDRRQGRTTGRRRIG